MLRFLCCYDLYFIHYSELLRASLNHHICAYGGNCAFVIFITVLLYLRILIEANAYSISL